MNHIKINFLTFFTGSNEKTDLGCNALKADQTINQTITLGTYLKLDKFP
jgi:hypothetical protein